MGPKEINDWLKLLKKKKIKAIIILICCLIIGVTSMLLNGYLGEVGKRVAGSSKETDRPSISSIGQKGGITAQNVIVVENQKQTAKPTSTEQPRKKSEKKTIAVTKPIPYHILTFEGLTWEEMDYRMKNDPKASGFSLPNVMELKAMVRRLPDDEFQRNFFWSSDINQDKIYTVNLQTGTVLLQDKNSTNRVVLIHH